MEENECDPWFPLALEQRSNDEEEEIGVLEHKPLIIPLFPLPHCLHLPNLCQGPAIAPCLWRNPGPPTRSWWRTLRPLSIL